MANMQATIRGQAFFNATAKQCLERSNTLLYHNTDKKIFVSLFYGILDTKNNTLCYANAGQNLPLLFTPGKPPVPLETRGLVLGVMEKMSYKEEQLSIQPGELLLIYSDGISEAMNDKLEEFGDERIKEMVVLYRNETANQIADHILSAVKWYIKDSPLWDDMTLMIVKRL